MWGSWSAVFAKLFFRKKLIIRTGYTLSIFEQLDKKSKIKRISKIVEWLAYKNASGVITSSKNDYNYVNKTYRPTAYHALIQNYVDTEQFKPMQLDKIPDSICFVGRLNDQKNLFSLFEALKGLPCSITIIGSGEYKEPLEKLALDYGIKATFLNNIPNYQLPEIINKHQVFILPSLYEGMPKALLEAMSCGLPVIGTNVAGINEVIDHDVNGILCETDANSIRNAIIRLMGNNTLKTVLGFNARQKIIEEYSLDILIERELILSDTLLNPAGESASYSIKDALSHVSTIPRH
jgi:glycosyltransferase involved in cell wall biosynthesis